MHFLIWRYLDVDEDGNYTTWEEVKGEVGKVPSVVPDKSRLEGNAFFRIVEAKENTPKVNDMTITIGLTGNKIGTVALDANFEENGWDGDFFNTPNNVYFYNNVNWMNAYKAEMTYKFAIGTGLYRWALDTVRNKWCFVTTN